MGMVNNMKRQMKKARVDSYQRQSWIEKVRRWIYQGGNVVDGKAVSDVLNRESLSPTWVRYDDCLDNDNMMTRQQNAFSSALISLFNFYQMFVVDPLHEIELGTWKALFIHLLRLCQYYGGDVVQELNRRQVSLTAASQVVMSYSLVRFRMIPTFGRGTIRRFKNNVSDLKNFAARDYEDILQVRSLSCQCSSVLTLNTALAVRHAMLRRALSAKIGQACP